MIIVKRKLINIQKIQGVTNMKKIMSMILSLTIVLGFITLYKIVFIKNLYIFCSIYKEIKKQIAKNHNVTQLVIIMLPCKHNSYAIIRIKKK